MRIKRKIVIAAAAGALVGGVGLAVPAFAVGSTSWYAIGCGSSYYGQSVYASGTGTTNANTAKSGGSCTNIGVAIRYDEGYGQYVKSTTKDTVSTSAAHLASGGWHSDQNGNVTQHAS